MTLYLLTRTDEVDYDEYIGFVIRAESEEQARGLARTKNDAEDERFGSGPYWPAEELVKCELLTSDGESAILLSSFRAS